MTASTTTIIIAAIIITVGAFYVFTNDRAQISRSATVKASASDLFELLNSNAGFQTINPYASRDPELNVELFGPEAGVGSGFHFAGKEGKGTSTVTESRPDSMVRSQIDLGFMGQPVQTLTLTETDEGTLVTWTVDMEFGLNPMGRFFGLIADGEMGPIYELGLENLQANAQQ